MEGGAALSSLKNFTNRARAFTTEQAINMMLKLVTNVSEKTFLKLAVLSEKIVDDNLKGSVRSVINHLQRRI